MSTAAKTRLGIFGCGNVFERYVAGLRQFENLEIVWCADLDLALARREAAKVSIPAAGSPDEALAGALGDAELVLNLTPPAVHARVTRNALAAGKHVYVEKPLATTLESARDVIDFARVQGFQLGVSPDWVLGATARTARTVIQSGQIGDPIAAAAFITSSNVESWHPNPTSFFKPGAGPVFDLGPYYVSVLVDCLGPIASIAALERRGAKSRAVTAPGRVVDRIDVDVPTHATAILEFARGTVGSLVMSWEARERTMPFIEIYGTEGVLSIPMPHVRDGELRIKRHDEPDWRILDPVPGPAYIRGIGVAQMAQAIRGGEAVQASCELGYHVLEVLLAVSPSSARRDFVAIQSAANLLQNDD